MEKNQFDEKIFLIIKEIYLLEKADDTNKQNYSTKEIQHKCSYHMSVGTFYNKFKDVKKKELITPIVGENDRIAWKLTPEGRQYYKDYIKKIIIPNQYNLLQEYRSIRLDKFVSLLKKYNLNKTFDLDKLNKQLPKDDFRVVVEHLREEMNALLTSYAEGKPSKNQLFSVEFKVNWPLVERLSSRFEEK